MDNNITLNSIVFRKSFDQKGLSVRQSTTRGINTPDTMTIRRQTTNEGPSKEETSRYSVRFDRQDIDAIDAHSRVSFVQVIVGVPTSSTSSEVGAVVATLRAFAEAEDLVEQVLNGEQ